MAFGLACLSPGSPSQQPGVASPAVQLTLGASLERGFGQPSIPLRDLAIRAWSLAVAGGMTDETWGRLVDCVAQRYSSGLQLWGGEPELDDIASLFLVHAAMLVAGERSPCMTMLHISLDESHSSQQVQIYAGTHPCVLGLAKMGDCERMFSFLLGTKVGWPSPEPARRTCRGRFRACLRRWAGRISISVGWGQV